MSNDDNNMTSPLIEDTPQAPNTPNAWTKRGLLGLSVAALGCSGLSLVAHRRQISHSDRNSDGVLTSLRSEPTEKLGIEIDTEIGGERTGANFGYDVAISENGSTLIVGAPFTEMSSDRGTVRFFRLNEKDDTYVEFTEPVNGHEDDDDFGTSVAVTPDGNWFAAGAPNQDNRRGYVYLYESAEEKVHNRQLLKGEENFDYFGWSVAIKDNNGLREGGTRVAIGAPAFGSSDEIGYVRVFEIDLKEKRWRQIGSDILGEREEAFGTSVGLSHYGDHVVVGTPKLNKVAVYVHFEAEYFEVNDWEQKGDDILIDEEFDANCGTSVDVSADGEKIVIGCEKSKTVYTYYWHGNTAWKELKSGIKGDLGIGQSVSMSAVGKEMVFGEPLYGDDERGRAMVYDWDSQVKDWKEVAQAKGNANDQAGSAVSISADGKYYAMGAPDDSSDGMIKNGAVRVFKTAW